MTELLCGSAPAGGAVAGRQSGAGGAVRCLGDSYYVSADVGQFEPHDVVVMAFNHHVVIQAQKVCVRCLNRRKLGSRPLHLQHFTRWRPFIHSVAICTR